MKKTIVIYASKNESGAKKIVCKEKHNQNEKFFRTANDSDKVANFLEETKQKLNEIKKNNQYKLNILKKDSEFIDSSKKVFTELPSYLGLDLYLKNIIAGHANTEKILLDFVSDEYEIIIEPTPYILSYIDVMDLTKEKVDESFYPKKEFLNNKNNKSEEQQIIRDYFKTKPEEKVEVNTPKVLFWITVAGLGVVQIVNGIITTIYGGKAITPKGDSSSFYAKPDVVLDEEEINKSINNTESSKIDDNQNINNDVINVVIEGISDDYDKASVYKEVEEKYGDMISKIATAYGIDSKLLTALITQESGGISSREFNEGGAIGLCQIQDVNLGAELHAFNYVTNLPETVTLDMETLQDDYNNIKSGAIFLQNLLDQFDGNIFMALQAYNYGPTMLCNVVEDYAHTMIYANDNNDVAFKSFDDIIHDQADIGWLEALQDNYGDSEYIEHILAPFAGQNIQFTCLHNQGQVSKINVEAHEITKTI